MLLQLKILLFLTLLGCQANSEHQADTRENKKIDASQKLPVIIPEGKTIEQRFSPPAGFSRTDAIPHSFAEYLINLPLKPDGSSVKYFDGASKTKAGVYAAVVDLPIGNRDLHQCADAVMRLRAEYLYGQKKYDDIHFNFTNGWRADYKEWMQGKRVKVNGNNTSWVQREAASNTQEDFWNYMQVIFTYAGTLSLSKELAPKAVENLEAGDVFIKGGSPGHAVIVVDVAYNQLGEKVFMLAQSYMPAQELQILQNPNNPELSPWYSTNFGEVLVTPEWTFTKDQLKSF